eukprot:3481711-Rhodomonas_salina.1
MRSHSRLHMVEGTCRSVGKRHGCHCFLLFLLRFDEVSVFKTQVLAPTFLLTPGQRQADEQAWTSGFAESLTARLAVSPSAQPHSQLSAMPRHHRDAMKENLQEAAHQNNLL